VVVVRTMQISKSLLSPYRSVVRHMALAQRHSAFCHRLCQKYRHQARRALGFQTLLWRQPSQRAIAPQQHHLSVYPINIALHMAALEQHVVSRAVVYGPRLIPATTLRSSLHPVALTVMTQRWGVTVDRHPSLMLNERLSVPRSHTQQGAYAFVYERVLAASTLVQQMHAITSSVQGRNVAGQLYQFSTSTNFFNAHSMPYPMVFLKTMPACPAFVKPGAISQQRMRQRETSYSQQLLTYGQAFLMTARIPSMGGLPFRNVQRPSEVSSRVPATITYVTPPTVLRFAAPQEETASTTKALRPMEFAYLAPVATTLARPHTDAQVVQQHNGVAGLVEAQTMRTPAFPGAAQTPSLDMNRLTDQVYQALERKIRLERQRRGYR